MFNDRFLIEADGRVVGVAVCVRGGFMFFSSDPDLKELEAKIFPRAKSIGRQVAEFARAKTGANDQFPAGRGNVVPLPPREGDRRYTDDTPPPHAG